MALLFVESHQRAQGGTATFGANNTNAAQNDTITFSKAGTYGVTVTVSDANGFSTTSSLQINVVSTLSGIAVYPAGAKVAAGSSTLKVTGSSEALAAVAVDQFGNALATQPSFTWNTTAEPSGAAPTISGTGGNVTVNFTKVGSYTESVSATVGGVKLTSAAAISVVAEPSSFVVTMAGGAPSGSSTVTGKSCQFTVSQFYDQFHNPVSTATSLKWLAATLPSAPRSRLSAPADRRPP